MKKFLKLMMILILILCASLNLNKVKAKDMNFLYLSEVAVGENVYVQANETINSDVISLGGNIFIKGKVQGGTMSIGGNVYIDGEVDGNATSIGGKVFIGKKGILKGKESQIANNIKVPSSYQINQKIVSIKLTEKNKVIMFFIIYIWCLFIYKCMPKNIIQMVYNFNSIINISFKYGYIAVLIIPFILIALILTILGTVFVPVILFIMIILSMIGVTVLNIYIGKKILKSIKVNIRCEIHMFFGLSIIALISNIIFNYLNNIIFLSILLFILFPLSIGMLISTKFGRFESWKKESYTKWDWYNQK